MSVRTEEDRYPALHAAVRFLRRYSCLWAGGGGGLGMALVFLLLTRQQVTEIRHLQMEVLPPWVWLQCQGDMRCRTTMLSGWLNARAPEGLTVTVASQSLTLTLPGRRDEGGVRSGRVALFLSRVERDWRKENAAWQASAQTGCTREVRGTALCAGMLLLTTRAQTGPVLTMSAQGVTPRYEPLWVIMASVLSGLVTGSMVRVYRENNAHRGGGGAL